MSQDSPETVCESTHSVRTLNTPVMIYTGYLLVIVLPTNCVSLPGKYFIPLSLSTSLSHYLPSRSLRSSNTNLLTRPPGITSNFLSGLFCVCIFYLELSTCTHSFYWHPIHLKKRHRKFHLFQSAFTVQSSCASTSDSFSRFLELYKFVHTYCFHQCFDAVRWAAGRAPGL